MNCIAIDPGTTESAIVQWDGERVHEPAIVPNGEILRALCIVPIQPMTLCIEMIASYGMPVGKEVFDTCVWIGEFKRQWKVTTAMDARLIYRRDVKMHHCGSARAKDGNIRQALIDKYGAPGTKKEPGKTYGLKSHLWAAFALATYATETSGGPA